MEKDIFAPKELSQKLREIGFDEPCIAYYDPTNSLPEFPILYVSDSKKNSQEYKCITAPTWEQVFKWFRERDIEGSIFNCYESCDNYSHYVATVDYYYDRVLYKRDLDDYEEAREMVVLKMIEIYKNEQRVNKK